MDNNEAVIERLRRYAPRFKDILEIAGVPEELGLVSFPAMHMGESIGKRLGDHFEYKDGRFFGLIGFPGIAFLRIALPNDGIVIEPPLESPDAVSIAIPMPVNGQPCPHYSDLGDVDDEILDGIAAHEIAHYLEDKNKIHGKSKYILRRRAHRNTYGNNAVIKRYKVVDGSGKIHIILKRICSSYEHAATDIIGSHIVGKGPAISCLNYVKRHRIDSPEIVNDFDYRIGEVQTYG